MSTLKLTVEKIRDANWGLWYRQAMAILALELRRGLSFGRSLFVVLLAGAPVFILAVRALLPLDRELVEGLGGTSILYAVIFRTFFLRLAIFFGCVAVFTRLFRGDTLEKVMHYYFLVPVKREVLVVGKFLSGVTLTFLIFGMSTVLSFVLIYLPEGWNNFTDFLLGGIGLGHIISYVGITLLACIGYGALFLLMGLFFKNPIVPAGIVLGWEYINFLLPPLLKKFSVIYYLESLCPVPIPTGPITILAEPAPFFLAVPGLLAVTALILFISGLRIRRMEIQYGED